MDNLRQARAADAYALKYKPARDASIKMASSKEGAVYGESF
jgi:hypothetical protein